VRAVTITDPFRLMPPATNLCLLCAGDHPADQPHDPTTPYYQIRFSIEHGRAGTWADAAAHCDAPTRAMWERVGRGAGCWTEPPAGVAPIAEPPAEGRVTP
jgi:hypothetical protein